MLIKYHDQHIRDYRSDAKYRISGDNFTHSTDLQVNVASVAVSGLADQAQSDNSGFVMYKANKAAVRNYAFEYDD